MLHTLLFAHNSKTKIDNWLRYGYLLGNMQCYRSFLLPLSQYLSILLPQPALHVRKLSRQIDTLSNINLPIDLNDWHSEFLNALQVLKEHLKKHSFIELESNSY